MSAPQARILVADDQADVLTALRLLLKGQGYAVETASSPADAARLAGHADALARARAAAPGAPGTRR